MQDLKFIFIQVLSSITWCSVVLVQSKLNEMYYNNKLLGLSNEGYALLQYVARSTWLWTRYVVNYLRPHRRCSHLRPCLIRRRSAGSVQHGAVIAETPYPTTLKTALFNSSLRLPHLWTIRVSI